MDEDTYFKEIRKIEKKLDLILKNVSLSYPKPLNSKFERDKFFKKLKEKEIYNPQFEYEKKKYSTTTIKKLELLQKEISLDNNLDDLYNLKYLIKEKIDYIILQIKCFSNWGNQKSSEYSLKLYGSPDKEVLKFAKKYCEEFEREKVKFKRITPQKVGEELNNEINKLTNESVEIIITQLPNKVNIAPYDKTIKLNPNERFTTLDLQRLKVHEIGVHYMRYYNAKKLANCKILQKGTANYVSSEEGLAVYTEEKKGVLSKAQMYIYAGRVIATYYCNSLSFYELFKLLQTFNFKETDAYTLAFRAKRNICNTSLIGGYTRDFAYFNGYYKTKKYAKENDIKKLFFGKFKIEDLKYLENLINKYENDIKTIFD